MQSAGFSGFTFGNWIRSSCVRRRAKAASRTERANKIIVKGFWTHQDRQKKYLEYLIVYIESSESNSGLDDLVEPLTSGDSAFAEL